MKSINLHKKKQKHQIIDKNANHVLIEDHESMIFVINVKNDFM